MSKPKLEATIVRVAHEQLERIRRAARKARKSLNAFCADAIEKAAYDVLGSEHEQAEPGNG
jgi:uncharacterized protein (DUF1778 family)